MKKIKLLTPLLTINSIAMVAIPLASCSNTSSHARVSSLEGKKQLANRNQRAQYFIVLDKDTYTDKDVSVSICSQNKYDYIVSSHVTGNILVVEVTYLIPTTTIVGEQKSFGFDLQIKTSQWTETIGNFSLLIGSNKEIPDPKGKISIVFLDDYEGNIWDQIQVKPGEIVDLQAQPARPDATFMGWYDAETGEEVTFPCSFTKNTYLYANWVIDVPAEELVGYYLNPETNTYEAYCTLDSLTDRHSISADEIVVESEIDGIPVTGLYNNPNLTNEYGEKGLGAFEGCSVKKITLPQSIKTISDRAFFDCAYLENINDDESNGDPTVKLPNSITSIGTKAFGYCSNMKKILLPKDLIELHGLVFQFCDKLECNYYDNNHQGYLGTETNDHFLLYYVDVENGDETLTLNPDCKIIGNYCFTDYYKKEKIKYVVLPDDLVSIGFAGFCSSTIVGAYPASGSLTEDYYWTMPQSLKYIGAGAFSQNDNLHKLNLSSCSKLTELSEYLAAASGLSVIMFAKNITTIKNEAFAYCTNLTYFNLSGINTIEGNPFSGITPKIDGTDKFVVYENCLYECDESGNKKSLICLLDQKLTEVTIPEGVTSIRDKALTCWDSSLSVLESIELPSTLEEIGDDAFCFCKKLESVNWENTNNLKKIGANAFEATLIQDIYIGDSVESIGAKAFSDCNKVNTITFSDICQLTKIPESCFENCGIGGDLESVSLPSTIQYIEDKAFFDCRFKSIELNEGLESIGSLAFGGLLNHLVDAPYIPESVVYIGPGAFSISNPSEAVQQLCPIFVDQNNEWIISKWSCDSDGVIPPRWNDFIQIETNTFVPTEDEVNTTLRYLTMHIDGEDAYMYSWVKDIEA